MTMKIQRSVFGTLESGQTVSMFTVSNDTISFSAIDYGCCITNILLPAKEGSFDDVVLGYADLEAYEHNEPHFGSLIGRCAGRIRNGEFVLDGIRYTLDKNTADAKHCLHSGFRSYDRMMWQAEPFEKTDEAGVRFFRRSPDGEQGFPGDVRLHVSYSLTLDNTIIIRYEAETDHITPVNLTNHTYFNLNPVSGCCGTEQNTALHHQVQILSERYTEVDNDLLPTGAFVPVEGTVFDFRRLRTLNSLQSEYDGTWLLDKTETECVPAAVVREPDTGRELHISTTQPAFTMYTANFLTGEKGKSGIRYGKHSAVCFETQHVPDSVHHPAFPSVMVTPDKPYRHETRWHFELGI